MPTNIEFKVRTNQLKIQEEKLQSLQPIFIGLDHQIDTYFNTQKGRLKLRQGNIENALIHYNRSNVANAKQSDVLLYSTVEAETLKEILIQSNGVKVVVDKLRKIYFIDNVKFHFDEVKELGSFIEVEAIDRDGSISIHQLKEQCNFYIRFFNINPSDFVEVSYSDLLLK
ncbi:MAG: class IV adenylate cyclase [Chitinophagaceae bacterium]|nr:class IV adenylate cyclase [Chitinophagaceae bacterium]